jgi:hypothetical protein
MLFIDGEIDPDRLFGLRLSVDKYVIFHNEDGIVPDNVLFERYNYFKLVMLPIDPWMVPDRVFPSKSITRSSVNNPILEGMEPLKELL